jgi:hypothetical protein
MSDIFVSYKREDEERVARLVQALEAEGQRVWWDRGLPAGESWRDQIHDAIHQAKCVIVIWSRASVGPAGDFVRDEAALARRRGVLVPVMLDKVDPPLGFGEIQAIDLTHWRGSRRDPFFKDLIAAVAAKSEGRPVPPATGAMKKLLWRLAYSRTVHTVLALGVVSFVLVRVQDPVCAMRVAQPGLSDQCGAWGIGSRPTREERLAWEGREKGSCADLRAHIERFPDGTYRDQAAGMLQARRVTQTEAWVPSTRRLALTHPQEDVSHNDEASAREAALAGAQWTAERLCKGFAASTLFRLKSARAVAQEWNCSRVAGGVACGFEGEAVCEMEERHMGEVESCGK